MVAVHHVGFLKGQIFNCQ